MMPKNGDTSTYRAMNGNIVTVEYIGEAVSFGGRRYFFVKVNDQRRLWAEANLREVFGNIS